MLRPAPGADWGSTGATHLLALPLSAAGDEAYSNVHDLGGNLLFCDGHGNIARSNHFGERFGLTTAQFERRVVGQPDDDNTVLNNACTAAF